MEKKFIVTKSQLKRLVTKSATDEYIKRNLTYFHDRGVPLWVDVDAGEAQDLPFSNVPKKKVTNQQILNSTHALLTRLGLPKLSDIGDTEFVHNSGVLNRDKSKSVVSTYKVKVFFNNIEDTEKVMRKLGKQYWS